MASSYRQAGRAEPYAAQALDRVRDPLRFWHVLFRKSLLSEVLMSAATKTRRAKRTAGTVRRQGALRSLAQDCCLITRSFCSPSSRPAPSLHRSKRVRCRSIKTAKTGMSRHSADSSSGCIVGMASLRRIVSPTRPAPLCFLSLLAISVRNRGRSKRRLYESGSITFGAEGAEGPTR